VERLAGPGIVLSRVAPPSPPNPLAARWFTNSPGPLPGDQGFLIQGGPAAAGLLSASGTLWNELSDHAFKREPLCRRA